MNTGKQFIKIMTVIQAFLLTLAMGAYFNNLFILRIHTIPLVLLATFFLGIIYFFDKYKRNLLTYFVITGILLTFIIISRLLKVNLIEKISNVINWCNTYNGEENLYVKHYSMTVMVAIVFFSAIIIYLLDDIKIVKNIAAAVLPVLLIISAVRKTSIPKITVGVIIFFSLSSLAEYCGKWYCKSSDKINNSMATVYLAPACIIIGLFSIILPSSSEPIQWKGIKQFIHKVQEQSSLFFNQLEFFFDQAGYEFTVTFSGYSEDNKELGGELNLNKDIDLKVTTQNKSTGAGYLIGAISDTYTGRSWEKSKRDSEYEYEDYIYDFYELLSAFAKEEIGGNDLFDIVKSRNYNIEYYHIKTRSIFYPLKTNYINFNGNLKLIETPQGAFLSKKIKGNGFRYQVNYYELNLNHELFQKMLRNGVKDREFVSLEELKNTAKVVFNYDISQMDVNPERLRKDLSCRAKEIKTYYTLLPDSLPERVKILAKEITKDYENDYDKLKAIESYLNTLSYTTKMEKTPVGEDFVDYFLFHQKEGYCTYFASAFGVLARCLGIPTRYIEGFIVDYEDIEEYGVYNVRSSSAHAWVEAYLEGVGWIPFEPTPKYYEARYTKWKEDRKDKYRDFDNPYTWKPSSQPSHEELISKEGSLRNSQNEEKNYLVPFAIAVTSILLIFIVITIIYYKILTYKYKKKFEKASANGKLFLVMDEILHYLKMEGFKLWDDDTLLTFARRIGSKVHFNGTDFMKVANIFMGVRYGEYEVSEKELKEVIEFLKSFKYHLEKRLGKRRMFLNRFLYLHFNY